MNASHFQGKVIAMALALTVALPAWSQVAPPAPPASSAEDTICKIYQLRDVSENADVREWMHQTIPQMVRPGTWTSVACSPAGSPDRVGTITYDPKSGLMAIRHTAATHAEVAEFLKMVKGTVKELPPERKAAARPGQVTPAQFGGVETAKADAGNQGGYPVPAPLQQPKHLFHFVIRFEGSGMETALVNLAKKLADGDLTDSKDAAKDDGKAPLNQLLHFIVRYEGEGIIDANVVEFMKVYARMANPEKAAVDPSWPERYNANVRSEARDPSPAPRGAIDASQKRPMSTYAVPMAPATSGFGFGTQGATIPVPAMPATMPPSPPPLKVPAGVNLSNIEESRAVPSDEKPTTTAPRILQVGTTAMDAQTTKKQNVTPQTVTLEDIVRMTRSGVTAQIIVNQINVTGSTYSLTAEQIGWLTVQGVAGAVIEHMQSRVDGSGGPHTSPMGPRPSSVETPPSAPKY